MEHQQEFNEQIKQIFQGGKIHKIKWGADSDTKGWKTWSIRKRLTYAMELASAMNQAADVIQNERNDLLKQIEFYKKQLDNAESNLNIQKNTLTAAITNHNQRMQDDAVTIHGLESRIKVLDSDVESLRGQLNGHN